MSLGGCASGDHYSAAAGAEVLRAGGNAIDAVVAAAVMAGYSSPTLAGIGGAGLLTCRVDGRVFVQDAFGAMPGLGRADGHESSSHCVPVDFEGIELQFVVGPGSVAVPGLLAGLWELHERHGRMPIADVFAPTVTAAREGRPIKAGQAACSAMLEDILRVTPECFDLVSSDGVLLTVGDTLRNAALADTLEALAEEGPRLFYEGDVAQAIVAATEGTVTLTDLASYRSFERKPLAASFRGCQVYVPGAPSLSGARVLRALRHVESGPAFTLDVDGWGRLLDGLRESASVRTPEYERRLFEEGYLERVVSAGNTLHIAVADHWGNVVSLTQTVGETAGVIAPGTGIFLNNFLGEEDIQPTGAPLPPGHRMLTAVCPTVLCDPADGRWVGLGSAGSARIPSTVTQVLVHVVDGRAHPAEAVRRPRVHWEDGTLFIEGYGRSAEEVDALRTLADRSEVTWECGFFFGAAQVVVALGDRFGVGADEIRRGGAAFVV